MENLKFLQGHFDADWFLPVENCELMAKMLFIHREKPQLKGNWLCKLMAYNDLQCIKVLWSSGNIYVVRVFVCVCARDFEPDTFKVSFSQWKINDGPVKEGFDFIQSALKCIN